MFCSGKRTRSVLMKHKRNMTSCEKINRPLVWTKLSLFCWFGALSSAQVYMTIYLKSFGINAQTTAFVTAIFPLSRIIGPCISGPFADKIGQYKPILYSTFCIQIVMSICFLCLPLFHDKNRETSSLPLCKQQMACCPSLLVAENIVNESVIANDCYSCITVCAKDEMLCTDDRYLRQLPDSHKPNQPCHSANFSCYAANMTCSPNITDSTHNTVRQNLDGNLLAFLLTSYSIYQLSTAITYAMEETTTQAMLKQHGGNYGKQRTWAIVGMSVFAPLSGILVDIASAKKGEDDFSPSFYISVVLTVVNIISVFFMDVKLIPPSQNVAKYIYKQCGYKVVLFLSSLMFHGIYNGFIESFFFWYLQVMGSPKYLMGLTLAFIGMCSVPLSHVSKKLIDKFGCVSLITVSYIVTSACNFAFSYLRNPWLLALTAAPHSAFYHLMWIASANLSPKLVPDNLIASIQSAMIVNYFGVGCTAGTIIGGNLIYAYGESVAFLCMGISALLTAIAYAVLFSWSSRSKTSSSE